MGPRTSYGVSQMLVNSSIRYGTLETSAFCAKKLTTRVPALIISRRVGHSLYAIGTFAGV